MVTMALFLGAWVGSASAQFGNQPPRVTLSAASTSVNLNGTTQVTATATDADGSVTRILVYDGTTLLGQSNNATFVLTFTGSMPGPHNLSAVAFDNRLAQGASNVVTITVGAGNNQPPTVSVQAAPTAIMQGGTSTLTAFPADPDGTISKVRFFDGAIQIGEVTAAPWKMSYTPSSGGTHNITAIAYDNLNVSTTSSPVALTVNNGLMNNPPVVSLAASSMSVTVGQSAVLTATASDSDGTVAKVEFFNGFTLAASDTSNPFTYTFTPSTTGTFTFTARATDNANAQATSNGVTITVAAGNGGTPPPVSTLPRITLAMTNNLFAPGGQVTLTGNAAATVAGSSITRVSFYMNGVRVADDTTAPYNTQVTLPNLGTYTFYAEVQDSLGQINRTLNQRAVVQNAPAVASTSADIYRLLNQATFGFSQAEAARVQAMGIPAWINDQMSQPVSGYPDSKYNRIQLNTSADCTTSANGVNYPADSPQALCARDHLTLAMIQRDFFTNAMYAPDQLRQRVAWALSQILVTSANENDLSYAHVMSRYQNLMFQEAFGNYESLLRKVTYNPAMGNYLDMVNNDRAPPPPSTRVPNENYAREILQLFSINLTELNPDGTPILDAQGNPVPTYGQTEIAEFARVFTGYTYASAANPNGPATARTNTRYYGAPMIPYPTTNTTGHDPNAKTLLNGTVLPAGQTAQQDIDAAVRNVFMHPNTGVYIGKQLIQRLVTGNPSPAYVARVTAAFNNNGSGVRGDMAHVVRTILLDPEARGGVKTASDFGSLREPVLMVTSLLRGLNGLTDGNRLEGATSNLGQRPYYSPTVFNYFMPDSKVPNTAILGPEFGIHTTVTAVGRANLIYTLVYNGYASDATIPEATGTRVFLAPFEALADQPAAMVSLLNQHLAGGQFPAALEPTIVTAVRAVPIRATPTAGERTARARMAVYLMASSYDYQVQR